LASEYYSVTQEVDITLINPCTSATRITPSVITDMAMSAKGDPVEQTFDVFTDTKSVEHTAKRADLCGTISYAIGTSSGNP